MTLAGGVPTWAAAASSGITISDDTTTNATRYLTFTSATSGSVTSENVSSTKLQFNPSTGAFTSTSLTPINALGATYGGTSQTSYTTGDIIYASGTNTLSKLSAGTNGYVLTLSGGVPTWAASSGGSSLTWNSVQTSNFTAVASNGYPINTTSTAITVTLPSSPSIGQNLVLTDYAGTFGTNALTINPNGSKINSLSSNWIMNTNRASAQLVYIDTTQGWIVYSGIYTNPVISSIYSVSYLIVAGGGAGTSSGNYAGGGGGAGGLLSGSTSLNFGTTYTVTIGAGGSIGSAGNNSVFNSLTASGGGVGGLVTGGNGGAGGSGGGGGSSGGTNGTGGSGTSGQGSAGGSGGGATGIRSTAGGGGGASAVGNNGGTSKAGDGGAGTSSSITGSAVVYAGGGGGGSDNQSQGVGGSGGGGNGNGLAQTGTAGTANTGGGGGGANNTLSGYAGGSGVVILSIPTTNYTGTYTGTPTITTSGSNTILKFTSSGGYTA
jgi:hypothetical protein